MVLDRSSVPDDDDDIDLSLMSPELLLATRKTTKAKQTRKLNELASLLHAKAPRGQVELVKAEVVELEEACLKFNNAYLEVAELDRERKATTKEWSDEVKRITETAIVAADEYLKSIEEQPVAFSIPQLKRQSTTIPDSKSEPLKTFQAPFDWEADIEKEKRRWEMEVKRKEMEIEHKRQMLKLEMELKQVESEIRSLTTDEKDNESVVSDVFDTLDDRIKQLKERTSTIPAKREPYEDVFGRTSEKANTSMHDANVSLSFGSYHAKQSTPLRQFHGDPREWPLFIANFKFLVHDVYSDDGIRMVHLRNALAPPVRNRIINLLTDSSTYHAALKALKQKYGHPFVVARSHIDSLNKIPSMKGDDAKSLREFSEQVNTAVAAILVSEYSTELRSTTLLTQLLEKIPIRLRREWGDVVMSLLPNHPTLIEFDRWLERAALRDVYSSPHPIEMEKPREDQARRPRNSERTTRNHSVLSIAAVTKRNECIACEEKHSLDTCPKLYAMTPEARSLLVKSQGRCYRCLEKGHRGAECPSEDKCGVEGCEASHHRILHGAPRLFPKRKRSEIPPTSTCLATVDSRTEVLFSVVPVSLEANGKRLVTWALLDKASDSTFIDSKLSAQLGLTGKAQSGTFSTLYGPGARMKYRLVDFKLASMDGSYATDVSEAKEVDKLSIYNACNRSVQSLSEWPHLKGLTLANRPSDVNVLIGRDVDAHDIYEFRKPPKGQPGPIAELTPFGWCLTGKVPITDGRSASSVTRNLVLATVSDHPDFQLDDMVRSFIAHDSFGVRELPLRPPAEELRCRDIFNATTRHIGDRYESGLFWKTDDVFLQNNRIDAERKLYSLESRFARNPEYAAKYAKSMQSYIDEGHARKLRPEELPGPAGRTWYLSHHGVTHPARPGTLRVVFNASARFKGASLNDQLLKGPENLIDNIGAVLRFRKHEIALSADIKKMFLQVRVIERDQPVLRFLWRTPGSSDVPGTYQMQVHIFGATCSPSVCTSVLRKVAEDNRREFDDVADLVKQCFYVDNYLDSTRSAEEAIQRATRLTALLKLAGFELVKWLSSEREVLRAIPTNARADPHLDLTSDKLPTVGTLGTVWDSETDTFTLQVNNTRTTRTKRDMLREFSSLYDPQGFAAAVTVSARMLMQETWRRNLHWDETLPDDLLHAWNEWYDQLKALEALRIPRCLIANSVPRVAPLKPMTVPKLELQAAVLGTRLAATIIRELAVTSDLFTFWTDSTTTFDWIKAENARCNVFVAGRVTEILDVTQPRQWRHVPGRENPADELSRGVLPANLKNEDRYFNGPGFLHRPEEHWPKFRVPQRPTQELANENQVMATSATNPQSFITELLERSSDWVKATRVIAFVLRFINRTRFKRKDGANWLSVQEIQAAERLCLRMAQQDRFPEEIKALSRNLAIPRSSRLRFLNPGLDENNLIRVRGRLVNCSIASDARSPIIIPHDHPLARLLVLHFHDLIHHESAHRTLHEIMQQYWIIKGRATVYKWVSRCPVCRRQSVKPLTQLMAPLPRQRIEPYTPPFHYVGIDYFGPISVSMLRRTVKRYGALFTCMVSRAVHLEVVSSLETDSFLMAFGRFANRRGYLSDVWSDNGTYFVAGDKEIQQAISKWSQEKVAGELSRRHIQWHFNPPAAPHQGGVWESLVKSAKRALKVILKDRVVSEEELSSALVEVEGMLNSRPLTYLSTDPNDLTPLTPNHFLIGRASPHVPLAATTPKDATARRRWIRVQEFADHFWRRWIREYLPTLHVRRKWTEAQPELKENSVVLIVDENAPRGQWKLGRVLKLNRGPDGYVRSALVKTKASEYVRPIAKLCLLEEDEANYINGVFVPTTESQKQAPGCCISHGVATVPPSHHDRAEEKEPPSKKETDAI